MARRFKNIDLVDHCDAFPYPATAPEQYATHMKLVYPVVWSDRVVDDNDDNDGDDSKEDTFPIGYMLRTVFAELAAIPKPDLAALGFDPDVDLKGIAAATGTVPLHRLLHRQPDEPGRTRAVAALNAYWRARGTFRVLRAWRDELWPVYGRHGVLLYSVERAATVLFGVLRCGVHMTAYVQEEEEDNSDNDDNGEKNLRIWVPRRAADKASYPGMLDNTVAGGLMTGEEPFECLVREADEEASLPADVVRRRARAVGTVTYVYITDERAGGEAGYVSPECEWVYELPLPASVVPQPKDGEVESFRLCTVAEVQDQLARGLYKPNCAVVLLDFFVRHGILTRDNEPDYDAIVRRLHRVLPFPGPHETEKEVQP
ncbi:thiamin pyrophosphokinase-related protein [Niveomyces insectorum RCEF 264]|uniref:Thiamin pyrophosphokinase-related protein n=1 Tax=Niveomyces insectorum RCEF 264 TaxID=1081102 RepID=A0A162MQ65_9HYPO|nr:thiamin pyrophosphokinase-related protein [Niveomyces insectorum RCEF 264]